MTVVKTMDIQSVIVQHWKTVKESEFHKMLHMFNFSFKSEDIDENESRRIHRCKNQWMNLHTDWSPSNPHDQSLYVLGI